MRLIIMKEFYSSKRFNLSFMVVTYFLPMSLLTATYTAIGRELWGQQAIGEATEVQRESIKSKRRVNFHNMLPHSLTSRFPFFLEHYRWRWALI